MYEENVQTVRAQLEQLDGELDTLEAQWPNEHDDSAREKLGAAIKSKRAEFDTRSQALRDIEAKASRKAELAKARSLASVQAPGVIPAEARTPEEDDEDLEKEFFGYIEGKNLSDRAMDALKPRGDKWKKAAGGVRMPARLSRAIIGRVLQGKALPVTSETATGNQLRFVEYQQQILFYPSEPAVAFPLVSRMSTRTGDVIFPRLKQGDTEGQFGNVSFGWVADGSTAPSQEPKFDQFEVRTSEASAYTEFSRSLLNRAPVELEDFMTKIFSAAILNGVDTAIFNGDGTGKPKGILASGNCKPVNRLTAGTVKYDDVIALKYGIPPQLRKNGVFFAADDSMRALEQLKDTQGRPLFLRSLSEGAPDTLDGRPVHSTTRLDGTALGSLIYCVPGYYMMGVEQDVVIAKSEHFKFSSGVVAFRAFTLIGGNVYEPKAFAALDVPA